MTDFPPGEWSYLLVGDEWPDGKDLEILAGARANRGSIETQMVRLSDALRSARTCQLSEQSGYTAEDLRKAFSRGEGYALGVAEKNRVKKDAYDSAYNSVLSLRHDLTNLAEDGNCEIERIKISKEPPETKIAQIVALIHHYRALASLAAAKYGGNVLEAIQRVLDAETGGQSARQFAQSTGIDVGRLFRRSDRPGMEEEVGRRLNAPPGAAAGITGANLDTASGGTSYPSTTSPSPSSTVIGHGSIQSSTLRTDGVFRQSEPQLSPASPGSRAQIVNNNLKVPSYPDRTAVISAPPPTASARTQLATPAISPPHLPASTPTPSTPATTGAHLPPAA